MSKEIKKTPFAIQTESNQFTEEMLPNLISMSDDPDYEYTFDGWYNGSMKIIPGKSILGDMVLQARWIKIPK